MHLVEFAEIDDIDNLAVKYARGALRTLWIVLLKRPRLVVAQAPSLVLSFLMTNIAKPLLGIRVVVDAHNGAIRPDDTQPRFLRVLADRVMRKADITIVTNEALAHVVRAHGGRPFVLPDPIPVIPGSANVRVGKGFNVLFVCRFACDEPFGSVFEAARLLPDDIRIYTTGNYRKAGIEARDVAANVILLGFVSDEEYIGYLRAVDVVIDLTNWDDCLVCGAYEAVAAGKPMILSDTQALRAYFSKGAVYTEHTPEAIANAVLAARSSHARLLEEIAQLGRERTPEWERRKNLLLGEMSDLLVGDKCVEDRTVQAN
jgi:glycosyltransferase involved in cell wall biosynthesis